MLVVNKTANLHYYMYYEYVHIHRALNEIIIVILSCHAEKYKDLILIGQSSYFSSTTHVH